MDIHRFIGDGHHCRGSIMGSIDAYKIFQMSILMISGVSLLTTCFIVMMDAMMEEK